MHPNTPTTRNRVARSAILAAAILAAISFPTGDVARTDLNDVKRIGT
jgi:hypothetical protein